MSLETRQICQLNLKKTCDGFTNGRTMSFCPCLAPVGKVNGALEEKGIFSKKLQSLVLNDASVADSIGPRSLSWDGWKMIHLY